MSRGRDGVGKCYLCGEDHPLSREHIPPKSAFNDKTVLMRTIDLRRSKTEVRWRDQQMQGGNARHVLCTKCNNETGHWYGTSYAELAHVVAPLAHPDFKDHAVEVELLQIHPLRVLKQALVMFAGTCGAEFVGCHDGLREFLLHKGSQQMPPHLKIAPYLLCHAGGRHTGVVGALSTQTHTTQLVAEVSWWPVGWVLMFEDNDLPNGQDISGWSHFGYDDEASVWLRMPVHWAATAYPMDFRSPKQVEDEAAAHRGGA